MPPNATLDQIESSLVSLRSLVHRLDRELVMTEEVTDVGRMRAPVTERLYESVLRIGGVIPSTKEPHVVSNRISARFVTAVDSVTHVTFDTAPNRVTARVAELAVFRLTSWIRSGKGVLDVDELARMRRLRSSFVALRRTPALDAVSQMRPDDLMHRSLRLTPKYGDVLRLHTLLQKEARLISR